jgi:hypothetical protein
VTSTKTQRKKENKLIIDLAQEVKYNKKIFFFKKKKKKKKTNLL